MNLVGYYEDCIPTLVLMLKKELVAGLGLRHPKRIEVTLVVRGMKYRAGIRTTEKMAAFKLCPDLVDEGGEPARVADLLLDMGLRQRSKVPVSFDGEVIVVQP